RFGVRLEGGRSHRVAGTDVSWSRALPAGGPGARAGAGDRLDATRATAFETYGGGVYFKNTDAGTITGIIAHDAQNAIVLADARRTYVADNDVARNAGWAIALWRATHNIVVRNQAQSITRCGGGRDCGAAAILLRDGSDSNTIVENDLAGSDRGVLVQGGRPFVRPSIGNLVHRNDATAAGVEAFADVGGWGNAYLENRADSAAIGFRLDGSSAAVVRGNVAIGTRTAAIVAEHGNENAIEANVLIGGAIGIRAGAPRSGGNPSRGIRIDDNVLAKLKRGVVLERTTLARVRGNLFDGVGTGLVADSAARGAEISGNVFLRAGQWYIDAPELNAGGNYWGAADAMATATKVKGQVSLQPWRAATAAGY
ncbi:MAG: right-handed parallel beta-helix repeat-containing protein, partial [Gemmatimonadales bacterium]|nr:right-handed parallel beta-helix repeat-containing protein [Gemmatimonadales bacterium]